SCRHSSVHRVLRKWPFFTGLSFWDHFKARISMRTKTTKYRSFGCLLLGTCPFKSIGDVSRQRNQTLRNQSSHQFNSDELGSYWESFTPSACRNRPHRVRRPRRANSICSLFVG